MQGRQKIFNRTRIFLVEDHPIFRKGLAEILNSQKNLTVCGEAEDAVEALEGIRREEPNFMIIDVSLKNSSGIELIKDIRLRYPDMMILTLSMHDEAIYAERALRAGAKGYLMKQEAPETVVRAVNHILSGNIFVSDRIATRMFNKLIEGQTHVEHAPVDLLTDRELEVFQLIGRGLGTRQIAQKLHVSVKTVENHRAHIKEKLNLGTAIELVQHATLWVQGEGT
jgi:DNA-binding NarL/FixJ family response regulator